MQSVVILGPAHPYRGGLAAFNEQLARSFQQSGHTTTMYTFTLQYPDFVFPGQSQFSDKEAPSDLNIKRKLNTVNPLNWIAVGNELRKLAPDVIIVRYWLPLMGPALGTVLRIAGMNRHTRVIAITDNIIPHEKRIGDTAFTRYFLNACDAFVSMSKTVMKDLRTFQPVKPAILVLHPLYDNFGEIISKAEARSNLGIGSSEKVLLFFGFIRKYKGLDLLLEAVSMLKNNAAHPELQNIRLLVAGEFYEDEAKYQEQIDQAGIRNNLILKTGFIPESEVKIFFCAADVVVQPYRSATQSGVTPLSYHFDKPMIVTNVGALPDYVPHEKVGLVTEPAPRAIAEAIIRFYELGELYFIPHLRSEKLKYTWSNLVSAIGKLYNDVVKG